MHDDFDDFEHRYQQTTTEAGSVAKSNVKSTDERLQIVVKNITFRTTFSRVYMSRSKHRIQKALSSTSSADCKTQETTEKAAWDLVACAGWRGV